MANQRITSRERQGQRRMTTARPAPRVAKTPANPDVAELQSRVDGQAAARKAGYGPHGRSHNFGQR